MANFSFAIVSDIHVKSSGQVTDSFRAVIQGLCTLGLRFVVMNGDATVGNQGDGVGEAKVAGWWKALRDAMSPLGDANIPILPIAGNHDYYTEAHRRGYAAAWAGLQVECAALPALSGQPPLSYSLLLDGVYLVFLHVVDQALGASVESFLRAELASDAARSADLRLAFGHVPLVSMMGRTNQDFCAKLGGLLAGGGVAAYFSGHEHLVWDQTLAFGENQLRQIHVGTASGCYHFPLSPSTYAAHCQGTRGTLPYTGLSFDLAPASRQQKDEVTTTLVTVNGSSYDVQPLTLRDGQLVPFGC